MSAKHTPGPWHTDEELRVIGRPTWPCRRFGVDGEWTIATVEGLASDAPDHAAGAMEAEANARLIAAAPDMREALYHAAACLKLLGADEAALQKIRAAIAKAEGRIPDVQIKGAA